MWGELASDFQSGNVYLWSVIVIAFIATTIIFERIVALYFVYSIDFSAFLNTLRKMVASRDLDRAMTFCRTVSKTSLPRIALSALEARDVDPSSVRGAIEEHSFEFLPRIEARINVLPPLATLVLLIGVLGTIDSLWIAFHSIDVLDTAKKQSSLALGIAGALNPTALGLFGAMLIIFGHQIAKNMAIKLLDKMQYGITVLQNLLAPPEVAYMGAPMAPMGGMTPPAAEEESQEEVSQQPAKEEKEKAPPAEEVFDDSSVEDIKDEEEII
ncbi:MAG: MotA/TolQ/ExbB proton channel family protein [Deltaproteobacteria bacterium]|nr:MotA/TolQ/ExbB proton channel family protein [Deltaproteobacteria bacterium]